RPPATLTPSDRERHRVRGLQKSSRPDSLWWYCQVAPCGMYLLDHSCPFVSIRGLSAVFSLFQLPTRHEPTSDQQGDCSCEIRSTGEPWRAKNPTDPHAGAVRVRGRGVGGRAGGILLLSGTECGLWLSGAF